jgi:4'-phosphopantetheinyl transferase
VRLLPVVGGTCDVWIARREAFHPHARELEAILSPAERAHVQRFRRREERAEARLSRALLRLLVARYLEVDPAGVAVDRRCPTCGASHGNPRLPATAGLEVSVSHSGDLVVLAFGATPVGVDVEVLPPVPEPPLSELLELALAPAERRRLSDARVDDRGRVFLWHWTAKEAVLKMLGTGLARALPDVHVPPPGRAGKVVLAGGGWGETEAWTRPIEVGPGYLGALATAREITDVRVAEALPTLLAAAAPRESSRLGPRWRE